MSNLKVSRRTLMLSACAVAVAGPQAIAAAGADQAVAVLRSELSTFLDRSLIGPTLQCGARVGDGVPDYALVEAFMARTDRLAKNGAAALREYLTQEVAEDHARRRIMIIDGWVMTRTEALAASALVLLDTRDCSIGAAQ
jgi:hypothetical protein